MILWEFLPGVCTRERLRTERYNGLWIMNPDHNCSEFPKLIGSVQLFISQCQWYTVVVLRYGMHVLKRELGSSCLWLQRSRLREECLKGGPNGLWRWRGKKEDGYVMDNLGTKSSRKEAWLYESCCWKALWESWVVIIAHYWHLSLHESYKWNYLCPRCRFS